MVYGCIRYTAKPSPGGIVVLSCFNGWRSKRMAWAACISCVYWYLEFAWTLSEQRHQLEEFCRILLYVNLGWGFPNSRCRVVESHLRKERRAQGWKRSWWTSQFKTPAWRLGRLRLFLTVIIPCRLERLSSVYNYILASQRFKKEGRRPKTCVWYPWRSKVQASPHLAVFLEPKKHSL